MNTYNSQAGGNRNSPLLRNEPSSLIGDNHYEMQTTAARPQGTYNNKYQRGADMISRNLDLNKAAHPVACICTIIFKIACFVCYLIVPSFLNSVLTFILMLIFASVDFWIVKNVTGRLLVGLRWWSSPNEEGYEDWYFESYDQQVNFNEVDSKFFWFSQIISSAVWAVFSIFSIIGLSLFWGASCVICLVLSATNLWGYYKCSKDYETKIREIIANAGYQAAQNVANQVAQNMVNNMTTKFQAGAAPRV